MRTSQILIAVVLGIAAVFSANAAVMTSTTSGVITREGNSDFWGSPWGTGNLVGKSFTLTINFDYGAAELVPSVFGGTGIDDVGIAYGSISIDGKVLDFNGFGQRYSYYYANGGGVPNFGQSFYNLDIGGGRVLSASNWAEGPVPMTNDLLIPVSIANPAATRFMANLTLTESGQQSAQLWVQQNLTYNLDIVVDSTAVPEPATWTLIGIALILLTQVRRRATK